MRILNVLAWTLAASLTTSCFADDAARFDLTGPKIDVRITRGSATLPISQVPNLQPGDKIWVKADLPASQSNHLILVVAFLRGTTNEPPDNWFNEIDTWGKKSAAGTTIIVPNEAQQALLFVVPETGGDFKTLRSAVKGKPGLFIRADADLNEASFEQQRIERYLAGMKTVDTKDPKVIADRSTKLAATLSLKADDKCLKLPVDQQVTCLTQSKPPVLLSDGHGQSIAEAMSTGPASDFANTASTTQAMGAGVYSAYVGTVIDLVHLVTLMKTAQFQYIPALAFPKDATLNLKLNAPPSFHNPKTVIVIGLPAIQKAQLPPLKPHDANEVSCLLKPKMALQLEGAPLVFSTAYAHDIVLRLNGANIPLKADAFEGGLVLASASTRPNGTDLIVSGTIHGMWGFDSFDGPTVKLQQVDGKNWKVVGNTQLVAGKDNTLTLQGDGTACVEHLALSDNKDKDVDVAFKAADKDPRNTLALTVPLKTVAPGGYALAIKQYGAPNNDKVPLTAYTGDIHLETLKLHTGDNTAILTGSGLSNVASVEIEKETFTPADGSDEKTLKLHAEKPVSPADGSEATAKLKDGRTMPIKIAAEAGRPALKLISLKSTPDQQNGSLPITLGGKDDIPLDGKLTFVVSTKDAFPRNQSVEVATADGAVKTKLSIEANTLVLQDEHTAVATLDPLKAFGQSAFGKLAMRPVAADGTAGEWTALGILVRAPQITGIQCADGNCNIAGKNFFLVQAFSSTKDFARPTEVPTGFADATFKVPQPAEGNTLYLKLRDDANGIATVTFTSDPAK